MTDFWTGKRNTLCSVPDLAKEQERKQSVAIHYRIISKRKTWTGANLRKEVGGVGEKQQSKNKVESKCRIKTEQQPCFQIKINPRVRIRINCHQTNQISVQYAEFSGLFLCQNPEVRSKSTAIKWTKIQYGMLFSLDSFCARIQKKDQNQLPSNQPNFNTVCWILWTVSVPVISTILPSTRAVVSSHIQLADFKALHLCERKKKVLYNGKVSKIH